MKTVTKRNASLHVMDVKEVLEWMNENNCLINFINNYNKGTLKAKNIDYTIIKYFDSFFDCSFSWADTPEGVEYWLEKSMKWDKFLHENSIIKVVENREDKINTLEISDVISFMDKNNCLIDFLVGLINEKIKRIDVEDIFNGSFLWPEKDSKKWGAIVEKWHEFLNENNIKDWYRE